MENRVFKAKQVNVDLTVRREPLVLVENRAKMVQLV